MIRTRPGKRFGNPRELLTYASLDLLAQPTAFIEPETIGQREWNVAAMSGIVATAPAGTKGIYTQSGAFVVPGHGQLELPGNGAAPAAATTGQQVIVSQPHIQLFYKGYIKLGTGIGADTTPVVKIVAYNLAAGSATVANASAIPYVIVRADVQPQPTAPNLYLDLTPGHRWTTPNEPLTAALLNATGLPVPAIPTGGIGQVELNGRDLLDLAGTVIGKRGSFTIVSDIPLANAGDVAFVGIKVVPGAVGGGYVPIVAQPGLGIPKFTADVSSVGIITLRARNNTLGACTARAGTVLKYIVF